MTYRLGTRSLQELVLVHPDLVRVVKTAIGYTSIDFGAYDGLRTVQEQQAMVASGASRTMQSKHLPQRTTGKAHAVDLVAWVGGKWRWEGELTFPIAAAMLMASEEEGVELRWGGAWDQKFDAELIGEAEVEADRAVRRMQRQYLANRRRAKKKAFIDGYHFELLI